MDTKTIVAKFGGTSLADAGQFRKIGDIVKENPQRRFLVVSAPGKRFPEDVKVTDRLLHCYERAEAGEDFEEELGEIEKRFRDIQEELSISFPLGEEIEKIREHLKEDPDREYMASRGEYLNARLLSLYLGFTFVDPAWCICFQEDGSLDAPMTNRTLAAALRPLTHAVIAGFYGADMEGRIRTFTRGGSDITGSLAACAVHADLYENWTDVSGLFDADPRLVPSPKTVKYLTYRELRTLSYMGASVLHSDAVLAASQMDIPINIRNTNRPKDAGTMIVRKLPEGVEKHPVIGVAGRCGMSVIQVEKVMVSDGSGFSAVMLDILRDRAIPFEHCLTGIDSITIVIRTDRLEPCREDLCEEIRSKLSPDFLEVKDHLSMIAVTGEKDTQGSDANVRILEILAEQGIEISTINQGAGKLNLLIGVPEERYRDAIVAIHSYIGSLRGEKK